MIAAQLRQAVCALILLSPALAAAQHGSPALAAADRQGLARAKAQEGLKLYGADRWSDALASFREADTLFHAPSVTLYIARCQRKLGKLLDARTTYAQLLAEDLPSDAPLAFVSSHADAGKELELVRQRVPTLQITGVLVAEAQVTVNGAPFVGEKNDLDPGRYTVEVRGRGARPVARTITLAEGSHETLAFDLGSPPDTSVAREMGATQTPNHVPAYASWGIGGAGLVVGAVFGGLALAQASDVKAECPTQNVPCPAGRSDKSGAEIKAGVSNGGFGLALAGAVVGTVLFFVNASPAKQSAVKSTLGPGGVTLRF